MTVNAGLNIMFHENCFLLLMFTLFCPELFDAEVFLVWWRNIVCLDRVPKKEPPKNQRIPKAIGDAIKDESIEELEFEGCGVKLKFKRPFR